MVTSPVSISVCWRIFKEYFSQEEHTVAPSLTPFWKQQCETSWPEAGVHPSESPLIDLSKKTSLQLRLTCFFFHPEHPHVADLSVVHEKNASSGYLQTGCWLIWAQPSMWSLGQWKFILTFLQTHKNYLKIYFALPMEKALSRPPQSYHSSCPWHLPSQSVYTLFSFNPSNSFSCKVEDTVTLCRFYAKVWFCWCCAHGPPPLHKCNHTWEGCRRDNW